MSQRALALGVRDELRAKMSLDDSVCDVVPPPGKPPAASGELFVAVWEAGFSNNQTESRYDLHRINVTVTRRTPVAPDDREAEEIIHSAVIGLEIVADQIAALIHDSYHVRQKANNYLLSVAGNRDVYGFTEPLRFLDGSRTDEKSGEWFSGERRDAAAGRALTLSFGRALKLQSNAIQA